MKMTLHIDDGLLSRVAEQYGCESKTAAVDLALRELERRFRLRAYSSKGLGFTAAELRESVDPGHDVAASRVDSTPVTRSSTKSKGHGRRRAG